MIAEAALSKQEESHLADARQRQRLGELISWLEREAIPFYEKWLSQTKALVFTPGKRTAKSREALSAALEGKLAQYRALLAEARTKTASASRTP